MAERETEAQRERERKKVIILLVQLPCKLCEDVNPRLSKCSLVKQPVAAVTVLSKVQTHLENLVFT